MCHALGQQTPNRLINWPEKKRKLENQQETKPTEFISQPQGSGNSTIMKTNGKDTTQLQQTACDILRSSHHWSTCYIKATYRSHRTKRPAILWDYEVYGTSLGHHSVPPRVLGSPASAKFSVCIPDSALRWGFTYVTIRNGYHQRKTSFHSLFLFIDYFPRTVWRNSFASSVISSWQILSDPVVEEQLSFCFILIGEHPWKYVNCWLFHAAIDPTGWWRIHKDDMLIISFSKEKQT